MKLGNLNDLRALRNRIASLPQVQTRIAKRTAEELSKLARQDFDAQRTASGQAWKPSKSGRRVTLKKTGTLESKATGYTAIGTRVRASVASVRYARFQLKRGFLPRRLPAAWAEPVRAIASDEITRHLRGGS